MPSTCRFCSKAEVDEPGNSGEHEFGLHKPRGSQPRLSTPLLEISSSPPTKVLPWKAQAQGSFVVKVRNA